VGLECSVTGWSAVASATANATLAAVLAGFMLNGIVLLLSTGTTARQAGYVQALSLLFTAFVALGLDAYLFGMVTGDTTKIIRSVTPAVTACRRTWTEAMLAAGLLGIGTVAIIAGFVFLFAVYFRSHPHVRDDPKSTLSSSLDLLVLVCSAVRAGVALVVVAVLYMTSRDYLLALFGGVVPGWAKLFVFGYLPVGLAVLGLFAAVIFGPLLPSARALDRLTRRFQTRDEQHAVSVLKFATLYSLAYSVLTVIAAVGVASSSAHLWHPDYGGVRAVAAIVVVWVLVVPMIPLLLLTGIVVPSFGQAGTSETPPAGEQPQGSEPPVVGERPPAGERPRADEPPPGEPLLT
jgi:hypothetical protein